MSDVQDKKMENKVVWGFDVDTGVLSVDEKCYGEIVDFVKQYTFELIRYKDTETKEEALEIKCKENGDDNGSIMTNLFSLDKDIKQFMRYGVAFSDLDYSTLVLEIRKIYGQIDKAVPKNQFNESIENLLTFVGEYIAQGKDDGKSELCNIPINTFNSMLQDCGISQMDIASFKKSLQSTGYIKTGAGRLTRLVREKDDVARVITFYREKIKKYIPAKEIAEDK